MSFHIAGRFYTARDLYVAEDGRSSGLIIWDSQIDGRLSYCLSQRLQVDVSPVFLQSAHVPGAADNRPGNVDLAVKTFLFSFPRFAAAFCSQIRLPFAEQQNVPLHDYAGKSVGFGGSGLATFHLFGRSPEEGFFCDVNFGLFFHNDRRGRLTQSAIDTFVAAGTQQLFGGAALRWIGKSFGWFAEVRPTIFLQAPPLTAYSREDVLWAAAGFSYRISPFLKIDLRMDRRLSKDGDETLYAVDGIELVPKPWQTLSNYPDWRVHLGFSLQLKQGKTPEPPSKEISQPKEKKESKQQKQKQKTAKAREKTEPTGVTSGESEKQIDLGDLKELERRWRLLREAGRQSQERRIELMQREREHMESLLQQLRERLKEQAEAKRAEEEAKRAAEAARRAEEEAAQRAQEEKSAEAAQTPTASAEETGADSTPSQASEKSSPPFEEPATAADSTDAEPSPSLEEIPEPQPQ